MRGLSLDTLSRNFIRGALAIFTFVVLFLFQSAFWTDAISGWMRLIAMAVALIAYFRPHNGLLILAALTPLGQVARSVLSSPAKVAETLVLAFLTGVLLRGWALHRFKGFPSTRLQSLAIVFGFVVAASCIEQIWFLQMLSDFPGPYLRRMLSVIGQNYVRSAGGYVMIARAMLLLEGLALLVYIAHYCKRNPEFVPRLVRMALIGFVAAAAVNIFFFLDEWLEMPARAEVFVELLRTRRFSGHVGDVNGAGSFFAMALFVALGRLAAPGARVAGTAALLIIAAGFWLTQSRTALVAVALITLLWIVRLAWRLKKSFRAVAAAVLFLALLSIPLLQQLTTRFDDPTGMTGIRDRWLFLSTTISMLRWQPVFGVGVGQYPRWSAHFAPEDLLKRQGPDNAHNNFAQVAGELGMVGLISFIAVLAVSLWTDKSARDQNPLAWPLLAGLGVFMLTWLGGHPLLVPEIAYPFWITLALVPGLLSPAVPCPRKTVAVVALVGVSLFLSVPARIQSKAEMIDFSRISYGLSQSRAVARVALFVPAGVRQLTLPLRVRNAAADRHISVEVLVDDQLVETLAFVEEDWQTRRIPLSVATTKKFIEIELRLQDTDASAEDQPLRSSPALELGDWTTS